MLREPTKRYIKMDINIVQKYFISKRKTKISMMTSKTRRVAKGDEKIEKLSDDNIREEIKKY